MNIKNSLVEIACSALIFSCNKNNEGSPGGISGRYNTALFSSVTKTTVQFDVQPDYNNVPFTMYADIYQPNGDTATNLAAIIYAHGGGNTRYDNNVPYFCEQLAKKGYVVASIDYRFGQEDTSAAARGRAQLRSVQDMKSFIRYAKAHGASLAIDNAKYLLPAVPPGV